MLFRCSWSGVSPLQNFIVFARRGIETLGEQWREWQKNLKRWQAREATDAKTIAAICEPATSRSV